MLLSIIVPVYNGEDFIEPLFESLKHQLTDECEIVFINDGSKDDTKTVLETVKSGNPGKNIVVLNQENSGVSIARNNGLINCSGEYITFVDVDDLVKSDYISTFIELINKYSKYDMIITGASVYGVDGNLYDTLKNQARDINNNNDLLEMLLQDNIRLEFSMWGKILRKEFLDANSISFDKDAKCCSDGIFYTNCYRYAEKVYISDYVGYEWRRRDGSITGHYYSNTHELLERYLNNCYILNDKYTGDKNTDKWMKKQRNFAFNYQISKADGSNLSGKERKEAVEKALHNTINVSDVSEDYSGLGKMLMKKAVEKDSCNYYDLYLRKCKIDRFFERAVGFVKRRIKINN